MASDWAQTPNNAVARFKWKPNHKNPDTLTDFLNQVAGDEEEGNADDESFGDDGGGKQLMK